MTHYVAFCRLPKQTPECDDRRHAGAVKEKDRSETLQTESVPDVAPVKGRFPLDIQDQTSENSRRFPEQILVLEIFKLNAM